MMLAAKWSMAMAIMAMIFKVLPDRQPFFRENWVIENLLFFDNLSFSIFLLNVDR